MVSRLKRADGIVALSGHADFCLYLEKLIGDQKWDVIAEVSRPGIIRAARMYFSYLNEKTSTSMLGN